MKRILALLCALSISAPAYASNISIEPLLNNCYDSTNQALKAKISGQVSGDSITASQVIIQPQTGFGRTSFQVISSDGTTTFIVSRDNVGISDDSVSTAKMIIKESGAGNIFQCIGGNNNDSFYIYQEADSDSYMCMKDQSNVAKVLLDTEGNSYLLGGNVGVNTNTPSRWLDVNGDIAVSGDVTCKTITADTAVLNTPLADASVADDITLTNITQITTKSHTSLSDIGTNTHTQIDAKLQILTDDAVIQDEKLNILSNDAVTQNASISTNTTALTNRVSQDAVLTTLAVGGVSNTEIGYLDGVTSAIQTQLNNRVSGDAANNTLVGNLGIGIAPSGKLHIAKSNSPAYFYADTYDDSGNYSILAFRESNTDTIGSLVTTPSGRKLGLFEWYGVDATSAFDLGAEMGATQDGTAGVKVPTKLVFQTYSQSGVNVDQFILSADGGVLMKTIKSGANQAAAGAVIGELWRDTADNTIKIGV